MFNDIQKVPAKLLATAAGALFVSAMLATTAAGQSASSGSSSSSSSSAQVSTSSTSSAAGGHSNAQIYLDQRTPGEITTNHRYGGSYTVRNAPAVQPPSMGSGHPCSLSSSVGISLIGGGAAGGNSRVDEACLLAQMGQGQAALIMIARRDSEACQALRQVGTLPPNSVCTANERRQATQVQRAAFAATTTPRRATTQAPRPLSSYVTCSRRDDGVILARKLRGTPFNDEQVADYCRSTMQ
ncbi:hypothetical protein [Pseudooceanicola marinus]|uniref:hypothetical protein n=1 Tax=Pseudooceanicola marinus TaxID=396013 RepID=UPI001C976C40|nr:hypothetical protein [Pseudooceanicola marinus]MBY5973639.1 hypothetical protein [Ferrimonas balearica]MCA1338206.1 hypothetical protein [Pseudooceanicola marinus]